MRDMNPALVGPGPHTDEEIVARVLDGDLAAFELLMRRHNERLYRVARSVVRDEHEAEDIVQETYVRAYAHLSRFEGRASVATWLTRIAFHEALRRRRQRLQAAALGRSLAFTKSPRANRSEEIHMPPDASSGTLIDAIDALPINARAVVVLRLVQGLSTRETATSLRMSESNVKVLLHRGTQQLRERLGADQVGNLREQHTFGSDRCDRVVAAVFRRLGDF